MRAAKFLGPVLHVVTCVSARPNISRPAAQSHSLARPRTPQDDATSTNRCESSRDIAIAAPRKNIFQSLTDKEYADVTAYLHTQEDLNLTAIVNSTS